MANNFVISYIFAARDRISNVTQGIAQSLDNLNDETGQTPQNLNRMQRALRRTAQITVRAFRGVRTSIRNFTRSFRRARDQVNSGSKSMIGSMKGLVAGFLGFQAIKGFINEGAKFQSAMAEMSAITGATGQDLQFFQDEALRLGKAAAISQDQVATAFKEIASAKSDLLADPKGLSKVTEQVLLLKNAAGIELNQATRALTGSLNQFNASADDSAKFVDILAQGAKIGSSEINETSQALKNAGTAAALSGLSFAETNVAIQVLAKNELKGAEAGTALRSTLIKMDQVLKNAGPSAIGFEAALQKIKEANLDNAKIAKFFGAENVNAIQILTNNIPLLQQWKKEINKSGSATELAGKNTATFNHKVARLAIVIKDKLIRLFLKLEPTLSKAVKRFTEFIDNIKQKDIDEFAKVIGKTVEKLGKELEPLLKRLGPAIRGLFENANMNTFATGLTRIVDLIGKVSALITKLGTMVGETAAMTMLGFTGDLDKVLAVEQDRPLRKIKEQQKIKSIPDTAAVRATTQFFNNAITPLAANQAVSPMSNFVMQANQGTAPSLFNNNVSESVTNTERSILEIKVSADKGSSAQIPNKRIGSGVLLNQGQSLATGT